MTFAKAIRWVVLVTLAGATAAPAAAQLGPLKKKVKAAAGVPEAEQKAARSTAAGGGGGAGVIVVDEEVLERLMKGIRAGRADREKAPKEDTPYGRHIRAVKAYEEAKDKCKAGQATLPQRMAANPQIGDRHLRYYELMVAAQQKQDTAEQTRWADSMAALQDPACMVKEPRRPDDWSDQERKINERSEQRELEESGFDRQELGSVKDRVIAILQDAPPPDVSPLEKDAVKQREKDLKDLMGLNPAPAAPAPPPPAPAAATPAPAPTTGLSPAQEAQSDCMAKNAQKHEKKIEELGQRAAAAAEGGNTPLAMAIADSIRQIQMAGCPGY
jgi:hypothetical protein